MTVSQSYPDGGKYVGGMVDGLREGFGRLDYEGNLAFYEGHWQQDGESQTHPPSLHSLSPALSLACHYPPIFELFMLT